MEILLSSGEESGEEEEEDDSQAMEEEQRRFDAQLPMQVLPLYSLLPAEQQAKVKDYITPPTLPCSLLDVLGFMF